MSFYNIENEEISEENILNELINYYQTLGSSGKTRITDFNEGSEVRTLLEVLSHLAYNILEEQNNTLSNHFINTAEGEYLDLLGANPNVNLERNQGTLATGLVKFTLPEVNINEVEIPAETVVSTDEMEYITVEDAYIPIGDTYTYVPVECTIEGADGNCKIGEITNCELTDFTVTNEEAFTDGSDFEDDEDYRTRLLEFIRSDNFGSRGYYENVLLNTSGVHDILLNTGSSSSIAYYVNTNDLSTTGSVYGELVSYFSDNNNFIVGHTTDLVMSRLHRLSFTVTVPSDCGYTSDELVDILSCYFRGGEVQNYPVFYDGLDMGVEVDAETVKAAIADNFNDLSSLAFSNISCVYDSEDTESFSFVDDKVNNAYSVSDIAVVFE